MSKPTYDGWAIKWKGRGKPLGFFLSKKKLIEAFNFDGRAPGRWTDYRKRGEAKAVKVRIVEV